MAPRGWEGSMQPKHQKTAAAGKTKGSAAKNAPASSIPAVMGLNDNLDFMGRCLHVQTENLRFPSMCILTQVFCNGRVVFSTRSEYPPGAAESGDYSRIQNLMREQHYRVIERIRNKKEQVLGSGRTSDIP